MNAIDFVKELCLLMRKNNNIYEKTLSLKLLNLEM